MLFLLGVFNLRGKDVPYNPVFVSYAIITTDTIQLYLLNMTARLTDEIRTHLGFGSPECESNGEFHLHWLPPNVKNVILTYVGS